MLKGAAEAGAGAAFLGSTGDEGTDAGAAAAEAAAGLLVVALEAPPKRDGAATGSGVAGSDSAPEDGAGAGAAAALGLAAGLAA